MSRDAASVASNLKFILSVLGESVDAFFEELSWKAIVGLPAVLIAMIMVASFIIGLPARFGVVNPSSTVNISNSE